jgi:uncharacterized protein YecE (DUF72 family)
MNEEKYWIGTSGFYYNHWIGRFYPKDLAREDMLSYYAKYFNTVELNSTFYHLPKEEVIKNWEKKVNKKFLYAVKGSKFITHTKRLVDIEEPLKLFYTRVKLLKDKLGPILFQLPPSFERNDKLLEQFLSSLDKKNEHVIEFRHESWNNKSVFNILKKHNVAYCIVNMPNLPTIFEVTANFSYIRMHGASSLYSSKYTPKELKEFADKIKKIGVKTYVYFNNDTNAYAVENAKTLIELLST